MTQQSETGQNQYQVRFDWGSAGARAIAADADVIIIVDVLGMSTTVDLAASVGTPVSLAGPAAHDDFGPGAAIARELSTRPATVVAGCLRNAAAVAEWALEQQGDKGDRFFVAVIAAGEPREDGSLRFALPDLLGAGAVIDALAEAGIDYYSPEAAAAAAAFTALRNATGHLIGASSSGRELVERGGRAQLDAAIDVGSSPFVPILREFTFAA